MNECNDPDHGAISAERSESRGLRKAWIELDDKRQQLERELTAARAEISHMVSANGNMYLEIFIARNQRDRLAELLSEYMTKVPLGNQPHMLALKADEALQSLTTNEL
jgi:hypothetical protein